MQAKTTINSGISPILASFLYPLGCYAVMPLYFGSIEVSGKENIPQTGPVIVAPTHRSRWDPLIVSYATGRLVSGRHLRFMVTTDEYNRPFQGWFIRQMGGFPINTQRPDMSSLKHSVELLYQNEMLVIFPEGGIFRDSTVSTIKRGLARIALEAEFEQPGIGVKILPISLRYSDPYPSWGSKVRVKIGFPISVAKYSSDSLRKSSQKLTATLETRLKDLYEEKQSKDSMLVATTG